LWHYQNKNIAVRRCKTLKTTQTSPYQPIIYGEIILG